MMKKYEVMYIIKPVEELVDTVVSKFNALINVSNGKVLKTDIWGKKRLAYTIQDNEEGVYILVTFQAEHECILKLDRVMRMSEDVLRHMIISKGC